MQRDETHCGVVGGQFSVWGRQLNKYASPRLAIAAAVGVPGGEAPRAGYYAALCVHVAALKELIAGCPA